MLSLINDAVAAARVAGLPNQLLDEWRATEPGATATFVEDRAYYARFCRPAEAFDKPSSTRPPYVSRSRECRCDPACSARDT